MNNYKDYIIINLTRIGKNGGGVQNAASFLNSISKIKGGNKYIIVSFNDGPLVEIIQRNNLPYFFIKRNIFNRILFEIDSNKYFSYGQLCFTLFGPPWLFSTKKLINVIGVAYSNLFYPEIKFWKYCDLIMRIKYEIIDMGRKWAIRFADFWIFETRMLAERAKKIARFPKERVEIVNMAVSNLVSKELINENKKNYFNNIINSGYSLLFLAGANPNKRIINIAQAINIINQDKDNRLPIKIITTLDTSSNYYKKIKTAFKKYGIEKNWINLGTIKIDDVASLIDECSVICNFSVLESFSNNFIEAWEMKKPLLVTDSDWSRESCGDAAYYVDPENVHELIKLIRVIYKDIKENNVKISSYTKQLQKYPTSDEKTKLYLDCIEKAKEIGKIRNKERRKIKVIY